MHEWVPLSIHMVITNHGKVLFFCCCCCFFCRRKEKKFFFLGNCTVNIFFFVKGRSNVTKGVCWLTLYINNNAFLLTRQGVLSGSSHDVVLLGLSDHAGSINFLNLSFWNKIYIILCSNTSASDFITYFLSKLTTF